MSLKPRKSQILNESLSSKPDKWSGPWGRINPDYNSVNTLRLQKKASFSQEESYFYPYRTLSRWHWYRRPSEEILEIEAGADRIVIKGLGLDRLAEALDQGTLEVLCEPQAVDSDEHDHPISIFSIVVKNSQMLSEWR